MMAEDSFDDGLLDDPDALARADEGLRGLAEGGARVRRESEASVAAEAELVGRGRPRAIVAAGADARLLRAVLEPWCPVPFVAWPGPGLPGWVGSFDLVVVLAPGGADAETASICQDAVRRGCTLLVACPETSPIADAAAGRDTALVPTQSSDPLAVAVVVLRLLHTLELGPEVSPDSVASALDEVAVRCSPYVDLATNPAKDLALVFADTLPLVWGGSVLAARAARRVVEALRQASGRAALSADARHLLPVLTDAPERNLFADPFTDPSAAQLRPALLILEDGSDAPVVRTNRGRLLAAAESRHVHHRELAWTEGPEVARYAALYALGTYTAIYLAVGLGRYTDPS